jgi:hypothetical protein
MWFVPRIHYEHRRELLECPVKIIGKEPLLLISKHKIIKKIPRVTEGIEVSTITWCLLIFQIYGKSSVLSLYNRTWCFDKSINSRKIQNNQNKPDMPKQWILKTNGVCIAQSTGQAKQVNGSYVTAKEYS